MIEDFIVGTTKLLALASQTELGHDVDHITLLSKKLTDITVQEIDAPLTKGELEKKLHLEEELRQIAVRLRGRAFVHLCAPDEDKTS
jgi:hypothetical protein